MLPHSWCPCEWRAVHLPIACSDQEHSISAACEAVHISCPSSVTCLAQSISSLRQRARALTSQLGLTIPRSMAVGMADIPGAVQLVGKDIVAYAYGRCVCTYR